jgi:aminoglycoside 6'-N-acetyltransferase I
MLEIRDLQKGDEGTIDELAALLVAGFREQAPAAWPTMQSARREVRSSLGRGHLSRVARDGEGRVVGWIGGRRQYDGHVWELHPLVVRPDRQGQGIGPALVRDLERCVRERGGQTLWLGTDDETGQTSLSGIDLYPAVWTHIAAIKNRGRHPFEFYQKLGFAIVGVLPDANGPGKPDIFMAKRVGTAESPEGR